MDYNFNTHIPIKYLRRNVDASLGWDEKWGGWPVEEGVRLTFNVGLLQPVAELLQVQLCLHVHMPASLDWIRGLGT